MPSLSRSSLVAGVALAAGSLVGCSSDKVAGPPPVTAVVVTPGADTLVTLGRTRLFSGVAEDKNGNPVAGVALERHSSNPGVATVDSASGLVTAVGNGLSVISASAGVVSGQANLAVSQLVASVTVTPGSAGLATVGATQPFTAVAKDSGNATVGGVRFVWQSSDPSVAIVDTTGLARSKGPGQAVITASGRGVPGNAVLTVTQAAASLAFSVGPTSAVAGEAINPAIQVEVRDSSGNLIAGSRAAVTLGFGANPGGATLHGSTTVNAVGGIATFSGITIETADSGYTLTATGSAVNQGTSGAFNVAPGAALALRFVQLDTADTAGQALPFLIHAVDRFGNLAPVTGAAFFRLAANPAGGILVGAQFASVITNGVGTLSQLSIQKAGIGYTLVATGSGGATGLDSAFSVAFNVHPATATQLSFTHQPATGILGLEGLFVTVAFEDGFGNHNITRDTISMSLADNVWGAVLLGTVAQHSDSGAVVFVDLGADKPGDYRLVASGPGFVPDTSNMFSVVFSAIADVAAGYSHTCAISLGITSCWGDNSAGQLGRPSGAGDSVANVVPGGLTFVALAAGGFQTCALDGGGAAYCWGFDGVAEHDAPALVAGGHTFSTISSGLQHTCGIASDSTAYCWGDNSSGQLGDSSLVASETPVTVHGGRKFIAIAAGANHSCGVAADSSAYCWGDNSFGQLGDSGATTASDTAVLVKRGHKFKSITAGDKHSCAVAVTTFAYCWGANDFGQLGDHKLGVNSDTAVLVTITTFTSVSAGELHTCGLWANNVFCWGSNTNGQLGSGTPPTAIDQPASVFFSFGVGKVITAGSHTCGIEFKLYCWGKNNHGQVGDATTVDRSRPAPVWEQ